MYFIKNLKIYINCWGAFFLFFFSLGVRGQTLTIKQALEMAEKNNLNIEIAKLESQSAKTLIKTAYDIPKTDFAVQYGNVNDFHVDYSFNVSQNFSLPNVYTRQKSYLESQSNVSAQNIKIQSEIVARNTKLAYISLAFVQQKAFLYQKQDSIFKILQKIAEIRQKTGETSKIEYLDITQKTQDIWFLTTQLQEEILLKKVQLQKYLRTNEIFDTEIFANITLLKPTSDNTPNFAMLAQEKQSIETRIKYTSWQKSLLSPDLKLGYYTMQEGENRNKNLHVAQIGVSVPIFNQAQKKRIEASQISELMQENRYKNTEIEAKYDLDMLVKQHQKQQKALEYYTTEQLPRLRELEKLAQSAYKNGETGYFQALQVQASVFQGEILYLQELNAYFETIVNWQYLTGNLFK